MKELLIPESLYCFLIRLYREYYQRINNGRQIDIVKDAEVIAMILVCAMKYEELQNYRKEQANAERTEQTAE